MISAPRAWTVFLRRSCVIGLERVTFSSSAAIALASNIPIQIGMVCRPFRSLRRTTGMHVSGSRVSPLTCISVYVSSFIRSSLNPHPSSFLNHFPNQRINITLDYPYLHQLPNKLFIPIKLHCLEAPRLSGEPLMVFLASTFHKDLHYFSFVFHVFFKGYLPLPLLKDQKPFILQPLINLVRHTCRLCLKP